MSPDFKKCEASALKLSASERAALAERLIASLDALDTAETERLWVEEAEARYQAYKKGELPGRPALEAIESLRKSLR